MSLHVPLLQRVASAEPRPTNLELLKPVGDFKTAAEVVRLNSVYCSNLQQSSNVSSDLFVFFKYLEQIWVFLFLQG